MKIERINSYNDNRFKQNVLNQHGAFLVDDIHICEIEVISEFEAIVRIDENVDSMKLIEEFRYYAEHINVFYDTKKNVIKKYEAQLVFWLDIAKIHPSQLYISKEKIDAVSTFINTEKDIIVPVAKQDNKYILLDGHTRVYYAHQKKFKKVKCFLAKHDDAINRFVCEAENRRIYSISDMTLLEHDDYDKKWIGLCDIINRETGPKKLVLLLDMYGCPNRCLHCWIGHTPNKKMDLDSDSKMVNYFKPFFDEIEFYSWTREPDYASDYEKRWLRDNEISINSKPKRFELASFYRIVRDSSYVKFLKNVGTKVVQLTFFGLENNTDKFVGRKGAFKELLQATNILIENEIAPRFQVFINKENINEIVDLLNLTKELNIVERCNSFNQDFKFFVHEGSPDGENRKLIDIRIDKEDIPLELIPYFLDYQELYTESEIIEMYTNDNSFMKYEYQDEMILYISNDYNVFYNFTEMTSKWKIGNIIEDDKDELINRLFNMDIVAIKVAEKTPISFLIKTYGNCNSHKAFFKKDYLHYLLLQHLDKL